MDDFTVITQNKSTLGGIDYVVFAALLLFSTCIGLFFAYFDSKKTKDSEFDESGYLVGNRSVSFLLYLERSFVFSRDGNFRFLEENWLLANFKINSEIN